MECNDRMVNFYSKNRSFSVGDILSLTVGIYIATVFVFNANVEMNYISQLAFIFMTACSGIYLMLEKKVYSISVVTIWFVAVLLLSFFSISWSVNVAFAVKRVVSVLQLVVLGIVVHVLIDTYRKENFFVNSVIISGYFMYFYLFATMGFQEVMWLINDDMRLGDEVNQENTFGYYSAIVFAFALYKVTYQKKWWYTLFLPLPVIMGLFSGSKKSLLLLLVSSFVLIALKKKSQIVRRTVYAVIIIFASAFVLYKLGFLDMVLGRTQDALMGVDVSTQERQLFIEFGLKKFKERPLIGYGIEQFNVLFEESYYTMHPSHNNYVQILVSFGIVGFLLWYGAYVYFFVVGVKNFYKNDMAPMLFLLTIITAVNDFTTTTLINKFTYVLIAFCFGIATTIQKENRQIKVMKNE